jgi:Xaa-Pro dipeptidase
MVRGFSAEQTGTVMDSEKVRYENLCAAEQKAFALLSHIEDSNIVAAGRTERDVEQDIYTLAEREFGVTQHWHRRIVRAGVNTLSTASDYPPVRVIEPDDAVYLDIGPVFEDWEADVGLTYAVGTDPRKQALCRELPIQFEKVRARFLSEPDITGQALYEYACRSAEEAGWRFGGKIAGHIVSEFPHARLSGKQKNRISPENPEPLREPDQEGRRRYWILEIHLVDEQQSFGGFYERLLRDNL